MNIVFHNKSKKYNNPIQESKWCIINVLMSWCQKLGDYKRGNPGEKAIKNLEFTYVS